MSFKEIFVEKAKKIYKKGVTESEPYFNAKQLIINYFTDLKDSLKREIAISCGELDIDIDPINKIVVTLDERELYIYLDGEETLPIVIHSENIEIDRLVFNSMDKKYYGNKSNEELTTALLDDYLRITFEEELEALLASPWVKE